MTMKNDEKIAEELTCELKIDVMTGQIQTRAHRNLKTLDFNGLLLTKVDNV